MARTLRYILAIFLSTAGLFGLAQDIKIEMDTQIEEELRMKNASVDSTDQAGFRIQIHFGSDLREAEASMSMFAAKYPELRHQIYKLYQQPYWKIRVGNYYREIDAQAQLLAIRHHFPDAFVVNDRIQTPPLITDPAPIQDDPQDPH